MGWTSPGDQQDNLLSKQLTEGEEDANSKLPSGRLALLDTVVALSLLITFVIVTFVILNPLHFKSRYTPSTVLQRSCSNITLRREWRSLASDEQLQYIAAVKCLSQKPSKLGLPTTRYNDFVYVHIKLYDGTHNVAPSLPWHRYYIHVFEAALRNECGYAQHLPYWDWTLDAADPEESPIWSQDTGFGGNGEPSSHCVHNGPFRDLTPRYPKEHCLQRKFIPGMNGFNYSANIVSNLIENSTTYEQFRAQLESGPHKSIHNGIGGEMPTDGSSNDPIFFVHHAQIDRLWWTWQQIEPSHRLRDYYSDPLTADTSAANSKKLKSASLEDRILMLDLAQDKAVSDVMSTESELFCYRY